MPTTRSRATTPQPAPVRDLVPYRAESLDIALETVNLAAAMAGLSQHTRRAYQRWIKQYILDVTGLQPAMYLPDAVPVPAILTGLGAANLKAWLGRLKSQQLGKQSLGQAKAAVVWLAQL